MFGSSRAHLRAEKELEAKDRPVRRRDARESTLVATLVSLAAHGAIAVIGAIGVARGLASEPTEPKPEPTYTYPVPREDEVIIVELPPSTESDGVPPASTTPEPPPPSPAPALAGGAKVAIIDTRSAGTGGDDEVAAAARNLGPRADEDTVASALRDDVLRDQDNHLDTGEQRQSNVDRRMALEPMELTFVASGKGFRYERKPVAGKDAPPGVPVAQPASLLGTTLGAGAVAGVDGAG
ncbi:MAG: hypothetical protein ABI175_25595, partial [Polyangiales bacterium]